MQLLIGWFMAHQIWGTLAAAAIWNSFVGSLQAPTKTSGPFYIFIFKFFNTLAFNFQRASSTSLENSPNFQDAVQKYVAQQNLQPAAPPKDPLYAPHL